MDSNYESLQKMSKEELISIVIKKNITENNNIKLVHDKYKKKHEGLVKEILKLQKFITKFREIEDKFNVKKGDTVFVEYVSQLKDVRTCLGMFVRENKTHIVVRVKDTKEYYNYIIKKKLINGIKQYYKEVNK